jgi:hypothetical protein
MKISGALPIFLAALLISVSSSFGEKARAKPNILLIVGDDLGYPQNGTGIFDAETQSRRGRRVTESWRPRKCSPAGGACGAADFFHSSALSAPLRLCVFHPIAESMVMPTWVSTARRKSPRRSSTRSRRRACASRMATCRRRIVRPRARRCSRGGDHTGGPATAPDRPRGQRRNPR